MSPKRRRPKSPKNKKETESVLPETPSNPINPTSTPTEEKDNSMDEGLSVITEKMKHCLNADKDSPEYNNRKEKHTSLWFANEPAFLKDKRFHTGLLFKKEPNCEDIDLDKPLPHWKPLPRTECKIQGEPGETYANIFMSIPGLSESDFDEEPEEIVETKSKRKKGGKRKRSF